MLTVDSIGRIGRKPTFTLAYAGIVLSFSWGPLMLSIGETPHIHLAVFGSLFFLIGGGIPTAFNTLNAMASDVSSDSDKSVECFRPLFFLHC